MIEEQNEYLKKMISRFVDDVVQLPVEIRFSKELKDCTLDEIEWAIDVIGDWKDDIEMCPTDVVWINHNTIAVRIFIFDLENKQIKERIINKQTFSNIEEPFDEENNERSYNFDFHYCVPISGDCPLPNLDDYENIEGT